MAVSELAQSVDFGLLPEPLAAAVRSSLERAIGRGAVFESGTTPLKIFQHAVDNATRDIRQHPRGELLQRFITQGPYECGGEFPPDLTGKRLTDDETAKAIRFVFSWMVSAFQGRLAELLAAGPIVDLLEPLKARGEIPSGATVYMGDAVTAPRVSGAGRAKAADLHALSDDGVSSAGPRVRVHALGEIKSYAVSERRVRRQLAMHVARCRLGLVIQDEAITANDIVLAPEPPLMVWVEPASWKLPRGFRFEEADGRVFLRTDPPEPPQGADAVDQLAGGLWHLTLRWSHEALAAAAYAVTFWYMERVGEVAFADPESNPWPEMSPADAGCNAATQSLYYAILRARSRHEDDRAIALYNMYGFGYAIGLNYRGPDGRRRMLWPEDLREILRDGTTREGCGICG